MLISFVIPAYNEELLLAGTLAALRTAANGIGEAYEIIVVDDASSDATADIAAEGEARVIKVANRQISKTRNDGAKAAHGDFLFFVDADTTVPPDLLVQALATLRNGAVGGGAGFRHEGRVPPGIRVLEAFFVRFCRLVGMAGGAFLFCRRNAFEAVGGFDEKLYAGEELVLSHALKRQGRFVILKDRIVTSGRKLRLCTYGEILGLGLRVAWRPGRLRRREGLDLWYDGRREQ